jgi:hypothetical protein
VPSDNFQKSLARHDYITGVQIAQLYVQRLVNGSQFGQIVEDEPYFLLRVEMLVFSATAYFFFEKDLPFIEDSLCETAVR